MWLAMGAVLIAGSGVMGCHHHERAERASSRGAPDSLVGVVSITGTSFEQHLVLRDGERTRELSASPGDSAALTRLGGVEIVAYGEARTSRFAVSSFTVISVSGAPVVDGVLLRDGARLALRTRSATLPLGNPPAALDQLIGARIWISGPLDSGPNSYGLIVAPSSR